MSFFAQYPPEGGGGGGGGVSSLNSLTGALTITGTGIGVSAAGSTIALTNTGVTSLNTLTGAITLAAGTGISLTPSGNTITVANTATSATNGFFYPVSTSVYGGTNGTALTFTGGNNTVIGISTGGTLTTGVDNILMGHQADVGSGSVSNAVAITTPSSFNTTGVVGNGSTALGSGSSAGGTFSTSLGCNSYDGGNPNNIAIGQAYSVGSHSFTAGSTTGTPTATSNGNNQICFGMSTSTNSLKDMFLGNGATPVGGPVNITIQPTPAQGTNSAGAAFTLLGGQSTGSGAGGSVIIQTSPATGSSASLNSYTTAATFSTTGTAIAGNTTGSTASAGNVGEEISAQNLTYTNITTTSVFQNVTSISLTPGNWIVSGVTNTQLNGATCTATRSAITSSSGGGGTEGVSTNTGAPPTSNYSMTQTIPGVVFKLTTTTTIYLTSTSIFSAGNPQVIGSILAVRQF